MKEISTLKKLRLFAKIQTKTAAELLNIKPSTLTNIEVRGIGPKHSYLIPKFAEIYRVSEEVIKNNAPLSSDVDIREIMELVYDLDKPVTLQHLKILLERISIHSGAVVVDIRKTLELIIQ
jgi:DNA-binding Lrp family transcriptional regulator